MGIDVDNYNVSFNPNHNRLLNTSVKKSPTSIVLYGVPIAFIFKREMNRSTRKNRTINKPGDGNQLIYALKRKKRYRISSRELSKFIPNFNEILEKIVRGKKYDLIIYLPSSYKIGEILANRVQRQLPASRIEHNSFRKSTVGSVLAGINVNNILKKDKSEVTAVLAHMKNMEQDADFSISEVSNSIRKYFNPIKQGPFIHNGKDILIVDDLYATGTPMLHAINLVRKANPKAKIEGLCLFSSLR